MLAGGSTAKLGGSACEAYPSGWHIFTLLVFQFCPASSLNHALDAHTPSLQQFLDFPLFRFCFIFLGDFFHSGGSMCAHTHMCVRIHTHTHTHTYTPTPRQNREDTGQMHPSFPLLIIIPHARNKCPSKMDSLPISNVQ